MKKIFSKRLFRILLPVLVIVILASAVYAEWKLNPIDFELYNTDTIRYVKGTVRSVNVEQLEESRDMPQRKIGTQNITVELTEGEHKGELITFDNYLSNTHSVEVKKGTRIIVKCDMPEGVEPYYSVYQYDRGIGILVCVLIFLVLICAIGKVKGLRSAIALCASIVVICGLVIPEIYNGRPPVLITAAACVVITLITLILLNGFSRKTASAVVSTVVGLTLSVLFYYLLSAILRVNGYNAEEAETLIMISRSTGLRISGVLFSGIMLASLGAVMDTSMSIASALFEIKETNPGMTRGALMRSGVNIGGDMIGTMCQTLILAFVGSSLASLLVVVSYGTGFRQFFSSDYFVLELLQSLTGSLAIILTVPITSLVCSMISVKSK